LSERRRGTRVGRLVIYEDEVLGFGSNGTVVLGARLGRRRVAAKRILKVRQSIYSPCECEHNNPVSLDARLFPSAVLALRLLWPWTKHLCRNLHVEYAGRRIKYGILFIFGSWL